MTIQNIFLNKNKEIESLSNSFQKQLKLKDENIQSLQLSNKTLTNFVTNVKEKSKNGFIYLVTTNKYANENIFKYGITTNLKSRLSSYNTSKPINDSYYYCYFRKTFNYKKVEDIISDLLTDFKDKSSKEIIILHFTYLKQILDKVIENINESYEFFNNLLSKIIFKEDLKPYVPPEILVDENKIFLDEIHRLIKHELNIYLKNNNKNIDRKDLVTKIINNLSEEYSLNKNQIWSHIKRFLNWTESNKAIDYKNNKIMIKY